LPSAGRRATTSVAPTPISCGRAAIAGACASCGAPCRSASSPRSASRWRSIISTPSPSPSTCLSISAASRCRARGYSVTAESASQDLTQPNQIDLNTIKAKLELADQGWANLDANTGQYDTKTEKMTLGGGINFSTSAGYGGLLDTVLIDVKGGTLVSDKPVQLTYLDGKLTADRMEVSQKTARALLTGNVRLNFRLPQGDDAQPEGAGQQGAASSPDDGPVPAMPPLRGTTAGLP
jgi:lipopolysaccharide assembly outer membrane protein LptD (OstA)